MEKECWKVVNVENEGNNRSGSVGAACIQINNEQIMIFGGSADMYQNEAFIYNVVKGK